MGKITIATKEELLKDTIKNMLINTLIKLELNYNAYDDDLETTWEDFIDAKNDLDKYLNEYIKQG